MQATVELRERHFNAYCDDFTAIYQSLQRITNKTERLMEGELSEERLAAIERHKNWILCLEKAVC